MSIGVLTGGGHEFDFTSWFRNLFWPVDRTLDDIYRPATYLTWIPDYLVFGADPASVTLDTILGAVCVYFLVGMAASEAYALIYLTTPDAFNISSDLLAAGLESGEKMWITMYLSFATMTTLGYGDITPASGAARAIAMVQAVVGQLYIAIIVARLVAIQVSSQPHK